jgi:flagella basal body P-ring formation protein FlgA
MDRMQWFIVGNLLGIAVLLAGVYIKESATPKAASDTVQSAPSSATSPGGTPQKPVETVKRVAALHDVVKGTVLKATDVTLRDVEKSRAPANALVDIEDAIGNTTKSTLLEGEVVTGADIAKAGPQ